MSLSHSKDAESSSCSGNCDESLTSTNSDNYKTYPSGVICKESGVKDGIHEEYLPQVDGGVHAWLFLLAATMLEALVWGKSFRSQSESRHEWNRFNKSSIQDTPFHLVSSKTIIAFTSHSKDPEI